LRATKPSGMAQNSARLPSCISAKELKVVARNEIVITSHLSMQFLFHPTLSAHSFSIS